MSASGRPVDDAVAGILGRRWLLGPRFRGDDGWWVWRGKHPPGGAALAAVATKTSVMPARAGIRQTMHKVLHAVSLRAVSALQIQHGHLNRSFPRTRESSFSRHRRVHESWVPACTGTNGGGKGDAPIASAELAACFAESRVPGGRHKHECHARKSGNPADGAQGSRCCLAASRKRASHPTQTSQPLIPAHPGIQFLKGIVGSMRAGFPLARERAGVGRATPQSRAPSWRRASPRAGFAAVAINPSVMRARAGIRQTMSLAGILRRRWLLGPRLRGDDTVGGCGGRVRRGPPPRCRSGRGAARRGALLARNLVRPQRAPAGRNGVPCLAPHRVPRCGAHGTTARGLAGKPPRTNLVAARGRQDLAGREKTHPKSLRDFDARSGRPARERPPPEIAPRFRPPHKGEGGPVCVAERSRIPIWFRRRRAANTMLSLTNHCALHAHPKREPRCVAF